MLDEIAIRGICDKIVQLTKSTAHVDTGALKRSISYTYVKGLVTFRMIYYGQWNNNAKLEENASKLIPYGVEWKIIYTKFGGDTYEVGKTRTGRSSTRKIIDTITKQTTSAVTSLLNRIRGNNGEKKDTRTNRRR